MMHHLFGIIILMLCGSAMLLMWTAASIYDEEKRRQEANLSDFAWLMKSMEDTDV